MMANSGVCLILEQELPRTFKLSMASCRKLNPSLYIFGRSCHNYYFHVIRKCDLQILSHLKSTFLCNERAYDQNFLVAFTMSLEYTGKKLLLSKITSTLSVAKLSPFALYPMRHIRRAVYYTSSNIGHEYPHNRRSILRFTFKAGGAFLHIAVPFQDMGMAKNKASPGFVKAFSNIPAGCNQSSGLSLGHCNPTQCFLVSFAPAPMTEITSGIRLLSSFARRST